ncbi:hypothetical protein CAAN1_03S01288 [[Candida] anglica]|uniref:Zn(2)-C6 fungal-type domain-containing protein n=1 Tax=[Candida] anglica TaxID=148631 RepID=A0ABP0EGL8_9ASCO
MSVDPKAQKRRRKHKNSKNGCPNCKKRRVKCSEDLPSCVNCIKHKVRCGYLDYTEEQLDEIREASMTAASGPTSSVGGPSSNVGTTSSEGADRVTINTEGASGSLINGIAQTHFIRDESDEVDVLGLSLNSLTGASVRNARGIQRDEPSDGDLEFPSPGDSMSVDGEPMSVDGEDYSSQDELNGLGSGSGSGLEPVGSRESIPYDQPRESRSLDSRPLSLERPISLERSFERSSERSLDSTLARTSRHFDNLLPNVANDPDNSIIYPVYSVSRRTGSMRGSPTFSSWSSRNGSVVSPIHSSSRVPHRSGSLSDLIQQQRSSAATQRPVLWSSQSYSNPARSQSSSQLQTFTSPQQQHHRPSSQHQQQLPLKGAQKLTISFPILPKTNVNYVESMSNALSVVGSKVGTGTASWSEIRKLYTSWINSFIYRSYLSRGMFSCLVNFSTNYLISNCLQPEHTEAFYFPDSDRKKLKNSLIVTSIKHYGKTIKLLRDVLNRNSDPELCGSISYILSLMSIYDPEATLYSINCFRDGLFSVFTHYMHLGAASARARAATTPAIAGGGSTVSTTSRIPGSGHPSTHPSNGQSTTFPETIVPGIDGIPIGLIPSHLLLMKNILRSVYLPGYDPTFLEEYSVALSKFGEILQFYLTQTPTVTTTMKFLSTKYHNLVNFTNDTLQHYVPRINSNLSDINVQQDVLFEMVRRWVNLFPSRLSVITSSSDPMEKLLYLFYKTLKKALYAIFPQVKFFLLRDFESPLMLEVWVINNDYNIFHHELDNPTTWVPDYCYAVHLDTLKTLASYLIRINTFLGKRIDILYRHTVYKESAKKLFPIGDDLRKWRQTVTDIAKARRDFDASVGILEVPILSFESTIIEAKHYPRIIGSLSSAMANHRAHRSSYPPDFSTLISTGLLEADYDPSS